VFCVFYAIHGVLREREFEIYAYVAAIIVVFSYIVINLVNNPDKRNLIKWVRTKLYICLFVEINNWSLSMQTDTSIIQFPLFLLCSARNYIVWTTTAWKVPGERDQVQSCVAPKSFSYPDPSHLHEKSKALGKP
jgi:hypothetical protein